ncbi:MAG TPA: gamma-glutamyltransferase [Rubrobacteraceae bacterium]|nr:gamma-glutamyltransferase [Rubrobacteraceae bacterium]
MLRACVEVFLLALLLAVLCSCGARSGMGEEGTSRVNEATGETTQNARPSTEPTGPTTPDPARDEGAVDGPASRNTSSRPAVGTNGMVSSAHPLATRAGLEILDDGGNAFDAAVAVAAALNVVEPMMSGIGGYGAVVVYDAGKKETRFLEVDSRTPAALDPSIFRPPTPNYQENRCGAPVVATPGNLNAWASMSEEYGDLEWDRLFDPAIRHAENGFVVGEELAGWLGSEYGAFPAHAQAIYGRNGTPLAAGERLVQRDLAGSLRLIADRGAGVVYGGELGQAMVSEVQGRGGYLGLEDLRANRAQWRETIGIDQGGYRVVTASRPATSWGALVRLGTLGQFEMGPSDHNSVSYVHALTEISKRAFTQSTRYTDPETGQADLELLLSERYWASEAEAVDFSQASPYDPPIESDSALSCSPTGYTPAVSPDTRQHTTHFVVADREGNVVSATQTLGNVFGSKVMPEGTGIWLNDEVAWARFEPAGNPFDAFPGRQIPYALGPTLVMRQGRPEMAIGTPGGRTILQTTPQMLNNVLDFDMDIQEAIASPRFSFVIPDLLLLEPGIPAPVRSELSAMGHNVYEEPEIGNAHGLTIEYAPGGIPARFTGGADPRGEGAAIGY